MRALQPRAWLSGVGQASRAPWRQESLQLVCNSAQRNAEAELRTADVASRPDADAEFIQLLSQSYMPATTSQSSPSARPLLAALPAAAELMEGAVVRNSTPQPVYDLPTFLASAYPHAGVHPRSPSYDWRQWAKTRVAQEAGLSPESPALKQQLSLVAQMDTHMQLRTSRETLVRMAKLELAHLWYYQQQQQLRQRQGPGDASQSAGAAVDASAAEGASSAAAAGAAEVNGPAAEAGAAGKDPAATELAAAAATEKEAAAAADADDDIFAAAERRARQAAEARQRQQQELQELEREQQARRDPLTLLPPELQIQLREVQRRAAAAGTQGEKLAVVLRNVAESFNSRIRLESPGALPTGNPHEDMASLVEGLKVAAGAAGGRRGPSTAADEAYAKERRTGSTAAAGANDAANGSSYWADSPLLSYIDNAVAAAHRKLAAQRRREAAAERDGQASVAAAVAALSASLPRPSSSSSPAKLAPPATPVLGLLLDYLQLKYQDLLHAWEVAARLKEATEAAQQAVAHERAVIEVQAADPLPAALLTELQRTWSSLASQQQPGASPSAGPMTWEQAKSLLAELRERQAAAAAATAISGSSDVSSAAAAAAAAGDLHAAAQHALAPMLAAAMERHRALTAGSGVGADAGAGADEAAADAQTVPPTSAPSGVVCFRETLVLDASSAYGDGSHDSRVSLEFDLDRVAASEPALGGAWGRRFLERLLAQPMYPDNEAPSRTRGSVAAARLPDSLSIHARRGPAARSAAMAAAFPPDVEYRFSRRTGTAVLTTARYASREANRKLLTEHYAALLRATTTAAAAAAAATAPATA